MSGAGLLPSMSLTSLVELIVVTVMYFGAVILLMFRYALSFDHGFRAIAAAATVYIAVLAGWRFLDQRQREVTSGFGDKQLALCLDAAEAAATIAESYNPEHTVSPDEIHKSRLRFQQLYYGSLAIVEDDSVANAMIQFQKHAAVKTGATIEKPEPKVTEALNAMQLLDQDSLDLAGACRDLVQENWQIELLKSVIDKVKAASPNPKSGQPQH